MLCQRRRGWRNRNNEAARVSCVISQMQTDLEPDFSLSLVPLGTAPQSLF